MRNRMTAILFCMVSVLSLWAVAASKPPASPYTIDIPYEYPYIPGTQEWINLGSTKARREASQVPDEVLEHMTTDALLLTVLDYPFRADMYAFNTIEMGYDALKKQCNGLREFENRPDYLDVLSQYCEAASTLSEDERTMENTVAETLHFVYTGGPRVQHSS